MNRIHITGGPGSGKSTLAKRLAAALDLPVQDLDDLSIAAKRELTRPISPEAMSTRLTPEAVSLARAPRWISDGTYLGWATPLLERAELLVWMDVPWRIASYRILVRHMKASLAGNNRFPGLRRLYRFWRWSSRYYGDRNPHALHYDGTPETRARLAEGLKPYAAKLTVCRSAADIEALVRRLTREDGST